MLQNTKDIFRSAGAIVLLMFVLTLVSWGIFFLPHRPKNSFLPLSSLEKKGQQVFQEEGCWYCHQPIFKGARGATLWRHPVSSAWLRAFLDAPQKGGRHGFMPSFRWLTRDDVVSKARLKALTHYISALSRKRYKGGLTLTERQHGEDLAVVRGEGKLLYERHCARCHGLDGKRPQGFAPMLAHEPPDLSKPKQFICRSGPLISTDDLYRTIAQGMSHSEMIPWKRHLKPRQIRAIVDYVRGFAPYQYADRAVSRRVERLRDPYFLKTRLNPRQHHFLLPERRFLSRPQFRGWYRTWWFAEYGRWKRALQKRHLKPWMQFNTWKKWTKWQRFARWIRDNPHRWRATKKDWLDEQVSKIAKYFPKKMQKWRQEQPKEELYQWLQLEIYKDLSGYSRGEPFVCSLPYRFKRMLPKRLRKVKCLDDYYSKISRKISRTGYINYRTWRQDAEKLYFKEWLAEQKAWLFMAWRGEKIYRNLGCASCHGNHGEGASIHLPRKVQRLHRPSQKKGLVWIRDKKALKIPPFSKGHFRCGTTPSDLFHTLRWFPEGKSGHFGISKEQLVRYLGIYPNPWAVTHARDMDQRIQELTAYVLFLARELPIAQ